VVNGGGYIDENSLRFEAGRSGDNALVESILAGNVDDFEIIVDRFQGKLTNLVKRHLHREDELDDALQDIFLRVYSSLHRFKGRSNLYTWIYAIAGNYLVDRLRKRRHKKISHDDLAESGREIPSEGIDGGSPAAALERREDVRLVMLAMEDMDPLFKNVLILREIEDFNYEELSEILGVGMGTVKSRLFRARAELKRRYTALAQAGLKKAEGK
jgi:RNA polymerase sigma-70 factor (ECF subfamily)